LRTPSWLAPAIGAAALAGAAATALLVNLRQADAIYVVPTPIEKPAVEPSQARPAESQSSNVVPKPNVSKATQLLAGGDVFVSKGDVRSARQLYERAVDFGDAQAALRLAASYDPAFLSRAGIQGVPGDPVNAAYWYKRAQDLGAFSDTDTLLRGSNSKEGNQRRQLAIDVANRNAPATSPAAPQRDPGAVDICTPPYRMTERDGCR
jgi:TPR repeat protein